MGKDKQMPSAWQRTEVPPTRSGWSRDNSPPTAARYVRRPRPLKAPSTGAVQHGGAERLAGTGCYGSTSLSTDNDVTARRTAQTLTSHGCLLSHRNHKRSLNRSKPLLSPHAGYQPTVLSVLGAVSLRKSPVLLSLIWGGSPWSPVHCALLSGGLKAELQQPLAELQLLLHEGITWGQPPSFPSPKVKLKPGPLYDPPPPTPGTPLGPAGGTGAPAAAPPASGQGHGTPGSPSENLRPNWKREEHKKSG